MKIITRNNYEEFFLDYIEGEISAPDKVALESFLVLNPDLKKELDEMMGMTIKCEANTISGDSDSLKAIPFQENFDNFCIAKIEGDLNAYENEAFDEYLASNPNREKELSLYQRTKHEADQSIIFNEKKSLKRRNKGLIIKQFVYTTLATAASIVLLFSIGTSEIENNPADLKNEKVSQNTSIPITTPDSIKRKIPVEIKVKQNTPNTKKEDKPLKSKIKGRILNKKIIRTDALPIRASITTKKSIEKIVVKQLLAENKILTIENINLPETKVGIIDKANSLNRKSTGLAMLGLSWKASKGDDRAKEKSALLKIASYSVNQIGKLAGKKINLEKKYDPKTDKTRIAFNTLGIGFSTPVK